ncbi:AtpZ/AtpI family protein [Mucilaginibacter sp. HMF5004]|uniref:AtpZ/AtpI family protein n=1 Tax=Mucilaginibacter rivuli TaxID=2857527 RepID=UPI001C60403F|nr:AtpZ/AtpI family protein [Mucilaginibacter rivuli]MBW4888402.1 AtpZ/AtpI family protein [Mucilaginibacter rivuli]
MQNSEPKDDDNAAGANSIAKYGGVAFQMIAVIGVFAYVGYRIDQSTGHKTQWVTALLALIGVFISMYIVFKSLKG